MSLFAEVVIIIGLILATINDYNLRKELKQQKKIIGLLAKAQYFEIRKARQERAGNGNQGNTE